MHACFLIIASVHECLYSCVCVCVCVCLSPKLLVTSGVIYIDLICLVV